MDDLKHSENKIEIFCKKAADKVEESKCYKNTAMVARMMHVISEAESRPITGIPNQIIPR